MIKVIKIIFFKQVNRQNILYNIINAIEKSIIAYKISLYFYK